MRDLKFGVCQRRDALCPIFDLLECAETSLLLFVHLSPRFALLKHPLVLLVGTRDDCLESDALNEAPSCFLFVDFWLNRCFSELVSEVQRNVDFFAGDDDFVTSWQDFENAQRQCFLFRHILLYEVSAG